MTVATNVSSEPAKHVVHLVDWRPRGTRPAFAFTSRNFVAVLRDGLTVLKYPTIKNREGMEALHEEAVRYDRLGPHESLVLFKGICEDGLLFEYCEKGSLYDVLEYQDPLTDEQKRSITNQITRGLVHLHDKNFMHCDLHVKNIFITSSMDAKVGDIQGQLYAPDGTIEMPTMSQENAKSRHPQAGEDEFSPRTDIFALGTLLYHLWHGHALFPDLQEYDRCQDEEIQARLRRGEYPIDKSKATGIERIICKCWHSDYETAKEVLSDMEELDHGQALQARCYPVVEHHAEIARPPGAPAGQFDLRAPNLSHG